VWPEDVKYFSEFLREFQEETDRGAALVGAALIDTRLERLLCAHFLDPKIAAELVTAGNAPLSAFSSRIKVSYALGLITELEFREAQTIRKIRNDFAHGVHGLSFASQHIKDLCRNLQANTPDGARFGGDPRQLFVNSVVLLSMALWYRPEHAASIKAKARGWQGQLAP
jgi:mannitol operon repressor